MSAYAEGFVLTARTEATDHMLTFGERICGRSCPSMRPITTYGGPSQPPVRPPRPDHPVADISQERIKRLPVLGGLISEYERAE